MIQTAANEPRSRDCAPAFDRRDIERTASEAKNNRLRTVATTEDFMARKSCFADAERQDRFSDHAVGRSVPQLERRAFTEQQPHALRRVF